MVTTLNRQIKTGHNQNTMMKLEALQDLKRPAQNKVIKAGDVIEVSRSEGRRLMATCKGMYRVLLD